MRILVDAMSGDNAPLEILKGASLASAEFQNTEIMLVGNENIISDIAIKNDISLDGIKIINSESVISMEDNPLTVIRDKRDSSMSVGLKTLAKGEVDAFVSAGNTGALVTGATIITKRIPGIIRAAIASILPLNCPVLLMDSGANLNVTSDNICQFAFMGAKYMEKIYKIDRPRVGQLNNGAEYNKGNALQIESYQLLSESGLNFVGNIEGKDVAFDVCDVLVTDGFSGNVFLKTIEGMGKFMMKTIKDAFSTNLVTQLSTLTMKEKIREMKHQFDASEHGGAPLLGITKPVIKAHGSSDAKALFNAIRQAIFFVETGINEDIKAFAKDYDDKKLMSDQDKIYDITE